MACLDTTSPSATTSDHSVRSSPPGAASDIICERGSASQTRELRAGLAPCGETGDSPGTYLEGVRDGLEVRRQEAGQLAAACRGRGHPGLLLLAFAAASLAGDPDMLQDVCVADLKSCESSLLLNYTHIFVSQLRCVLALADMAFS